MEITTLMIFAMATWRLASLLVRERGPWDVFVWIRTLAGIGHDENKIPYMIPDSMLAGILSCVFCSSMWVALGWLIFFLITPLLAERVAVIFAISAGAILIDRWMGN